MKRNWGNERTMPEYDIPKEDLVYKSIMESCMILDNNKSVQKDIEHEMNGNYRGKLDQYLKESKSGIWVKQRMPRIKQHASTNYRKIVTEDDDSPNAKANKQLTLKNQSDKTNSNFQSKLSLHLNNALNDGTIPSNGTSSRNHEIDNDSLERHAGLAIDKIKEV